MQLHDVRIHPSTAGLPREDQLAWKFAAVAADPVAVPAEAAEMIVNRLIDTAVIAIASVNRRALHERPRRALASRATNMPAGTVQAGIPSLF